MLDFIVTGLPRSGTTWLANWLTTDRSLCLHDPFSLGWPDQWQRDGRRFGISCTGVYLAMPCLLDGCPVAIIERDQADCESSIIELGFPAGQMTVLQAGLAKVDGRRFPFDDIWIEDKAAELWDFLMPSLPFDVLRYRMLAHMQVQPHMRKWRVNPDVVRDVSSRMNRSN